MTTTDQSRDLPGITEPYTRLHITPFDPDLVNFILPSSVLPRATTISYHTLQTFPEKRYGFVNLPTADAESIRKKLNGAVLKGTKIRIEPARPEDMPRPSAKAVAAAADNSGPTNEKKSKDMKKRKRDPEEVIGVELEEGRKVKRGWTVSPDEAKSRKNDKADKSSKKYKSSKDEKNVKRKKEERRRQEVKSKYTDGPECLVKTRLPPNKADLADTLETSRARKQPRKRSSTREVVVHEFEKTVKFPTFLKTLDASLSNPAKPTKYVDGKGWVDEDGDVVEVAKGTRPMLSAQVVAVVARPKAPADQDDTSSSGSSSGDDDSDATSSSAEEEDISVDSASRSQERGSSKDPSSLQSTRPDPQQLKLSGSPKGLTIQIPPPPTTPAATKVHPLEALYKRPRPGDTAVEEQTPGDLKPFSFFDADDQKDQNDSFPPQPAQPPLTPFSREDLEWRNIRSAAPTPDTAHPNRALNVWRDGDGDDDIEEDEALMLGSMAEGANGPDPSVPDAYHEEGGSKGASAASDFQSWFWEHRGDLNRSWKKRRKLAAKEKRYRENRARAERAI